MTATLVLVRHGQSVWNEKGLFTGWYDADLTAKGEAEAIAGAAALAEADVAPTVVHTSLQTRAIRTANLLLGELDRLWIPVRRSWRLNERHYGELQGKDKKQTVEEFGAEQVHEWRRSYDIAPPPIRDDNPYTQVGDARYADLPYADLPSDLIPASECLLDVVNRMLPYWYDGIVPDLRAGHTVLVAAHGNSLRALVKHLDGSPPAFRSATTSTPTCSRSSARTPWIGWSATPRRRRPRPTPSRSRPADRHAGQARRRSSTPTSAAASESASSR
jgi:2,3-bisphosphoglycerate-dependent phosphoglycerate mutase